MTSDHSSNRKRASRQASAAPKPRANSRLPNSRTVENLEALLRLLDNDAAAQAIAAPNRESPSADSGGTPKSSPQIPAEQKKVSPLVQELARVRDDLLHEFRSRIALEEEVDTLRGETASLQQQIAALEQKRRSLQSTRLDLELQLDAEQRQRELTIDQVDAINARLKTATSQHKSVAAKLAAAQRECESLKTELATVRSSQKLVTEDLQAKLRSMVSESEQVAQERDALQVVALRQESDILALTNRAKNAEAAIRERDELIDKIRNVATDFENSGIEWQERFRLERETRERIEQELFEHTAKSDAAAVAFETTRQVLQDDADELREQLTDARQRESEASQRANELSDEVKALQASAQREAAARRKAEAVHKRAPGDEGAAALFEAEQKIERLSRELAASRSVESAYQQKAARKVQQAKQELDLVRQRLAEFERHPEAG